MNISKMLGATMVAGALVTGGAAAGIAGASASSATTSTAASTTTTPQTTPTTPSAPAKPNGQGGQPNGQGKAKGPCPHMGSHGGEGPPGPGAAYEGPGPAPTYQ